jgi:C4-type Zn-finger protein
MIAMVEPVVTTIPLDQTLQIDVSCPVCDRHIAKSRHPRDLPAQRVLNSAYCRHCKKWRWYDVVTGLPPSHHQEAARMVG